MSHTKLAHFVPYFGSNSKYSSRCVVSDSPFLALNSDIQSPDIQTKVLRSFSEYLMPIWKQMVLLIPKML